MRHGKKVNHLGRTSSHRQAMLSNMAASLIMHKRIHTTVAKAKALRKYVEPLITKAKEDTTHSRRMVFSYLQDKNAVTELFREISQKVGDRPGGYTRILRTGFRVGDAAEMCIIELVDFNEAYSQNKGGKKAAKKSTRRSGRGKKKEETDTTSVEETTPTAEEIPNVEVEEIEEVAEVAEVVEEVAEVVDVVEEEVVEEAAPATQAQTEEVPAEEILAEEVPAEEIPVEETPAEEAEIIPVEEPVDVAEEVPNEEVEPSQETPQAEEEPKTEEE